MTTLDLVYIFGLNRYVSLIMQFIFVCIDSCAKHISFGSNKAYRHAVRRVNTYSLFDIYIYTYIGLYVQANGVDEQRAAHTYIVHM